MTEYVKTVWTDEVPGETPIKYVITGANNDCTIELKTAPTPGTPLSATNLNHIEQGIADASDLVKHRQGNSATNWGGNNAGTNNYSLAAVHTMIQCGCIDISSSGTLLTFPVAFSAIPLVLLTVGYPFTNKNITLQVTAETDHAHLWAWTGDTGVETNAWSINWLAIGPD